MILFRKLKDTYQNLTLSKKANLYKNITRDINGFSSYLNLGYTSVNTEEFKKISILINDFINRELTEQLIQDSSGLLEQIKNKPNLVSKLFDGSDRDQSIYYDQPILQYIEPKDFLGAFLSMPNIDKRNFSNALVKRYETVYLDHAIYVEIDWLEKLIEEIEQYLKSTKPSVSKVIMEFTHKDLLRIYNSLRSKTKVFKKESSNNI